MKKQTAALLLATAAITAAACAKPATASPALQARTPAAPSALQGHAPAVTAPTQPNAATLAAADTDLCQLPLKDAFSKKQEEQPRMLVYNSKLYIDTGEVSTAGRCGVMDGTIQKTVSAGKTPTKELQSNFGKGYGFQLGTRPNRLEVEIGDTWHIFAYNENNFDGVSIKVKRHSATSAVLTIQNTKYSKIIFGEAFLLEKKDYKTGEWREVPYQNSDIGFHDIGLLADKGIPATWRVNWSAIYGTLKPGTYRIVKEFKEDSKDTAEVYTLSAKFRIESGSAAKN
ncbi:MAG: hypothetical protein K2N87_00955 [Eubacterium sp.]|nr:hypothetical protein [Eubacterium sp.]